VVEARPVTEKFVVVADVKSAFCPESSPESVRLVAVMVPVAVSDPRYASPTTERRVNGEDVPTPMLPEVATVKRATPPD
jgi:hypothetical protein